MMRLLWGCVWRGGMLGMALGASLGAAYAALLLALMSVAESIGSVLGVSDGSADAWIGAFYLAPYGAVFGVIVGVLAGLPLGVLLGLLAFTVTSFCTRQGSDAGRCRRFLRWTAAALSMSALVVRWVTLGADPAAFVFIENTSGVFDDGPVDLVFVVLIPITVAGIAGRWISERLGNWCAGRMIAPQPFS
jgi:hypothetical protein